MLKRFHFIWILTINIWIKIRGDNWKTFNYAITDHRGSAEINFWPYKQEKFIIPSISINDVFDICNLESIDYLKVDIEGYERSMFNNTKDSDLRRINRMFIEWHFFEGIPISSSSVMMDSFIYRMNSAGFNGWVHPAGMQTLLYFWRI